MFKVIAENKRNNPQRVTMRTFETLEEAIDSAIECHSILKKFGTIVWVADDNGNEMGIA